MAKTLVTEQSDNVLVGPIVNLKAWPLSVQNNPRRIKDLPRLSVPMFGPLGPGHEEDPDDPAGQAD